MSSKHSHRPVSSESFTDPIDKIRDPQNLRTKQFVRKMNWDSLVTLLWIAGVISPVVFAFYFGSPLQLLKILFIPLAIFIAASIFNFRGVGLWISNVIYFVPSLLMLLIVEGINSLSPDPGWYRLIVLLQVFVFWKIQKDIPSIERAEWNRFKSQTGMTDEQIAEIFRARQEDLRKST